MKTNLYYDNITGWYVTITFQSEGSVVVTVAADKDFNGFDAYKKGDYMQYPYNLTLVDNAFIGRKVDKAKIQLKIAEQLSKRISND